MWLHLTLSATMPRGSRKTLGAGLDTWIYVGMLREKKWQICIVFLSLLAKA
jgi:hypothetical protein